MIDQRVKCYDLTECRHGETIASASCQFPFNYLSSPLFSSLLTGVGESVPPPPTFCQQIVHSSFDFFFFPESLEAVQSSLSSFPSFPVEKIKSKFPRKSVVKSNGLNYQLVGEINGSECK